MTTEVLIAEELRDLLDPVALGGLAVEWMAAGRPIPRRESVALISVLGQRVSDVEFDRLPRLRIVANSAVGFDNIDVASATRRGILVTNTPGVLTDSTADLTWALILAATRRVKEGLEMMRKGTWAGWHPGLLLGMELRGRILGIVGAGRIGQAVGRRAVGFGMQVAYTSRSDKPDFERATGARRVALDELLATSDVVTLHLPLAPSTAGLMNPARIRLMKMGAVLINAARGGLIDETALVDALHDGRLRSVGLDVFETEPMVDRALVEHPRVICLPHLGSATWETRASMANLAARNVQTVLSGHPPLTPVPR